MPVVNPRQGKFSVSVAEAVAADATEIHVAHVVRTKEEAAGAGERIMDALFASPELETATEHRNLPVRQVAVDASPLRAINRLVEDADVLIIGAATETWWKRISFTRFHLDLARLYTGPLLLAKLHSGSAKFAAQKAVEFFVSKEPEE